jgi:hypothetical protein
MHKSVPLSFPATEESSHIDRADVNTGDFIKDEPYPHHGDGLDRLFRPTTPGTLLNAGEIVTPRHFQSSWEKNVRE